MHGLANVKPELLYALFHAAKCAHTYPVTKKRTAIFRLLTAPLIFFLGGGGATVMETAARDLLPHVSTATYFFLTVLLLRHLLYRCP